MTYLPAPQRWTLMQPIKMFLVASHKPGKCRVKD